MAIKYFLIPAALAVLMLAGCPKDGPDYDPANPTGETPVVDTDAPEGGE